MSPNRCPASLRWGLFTLCLAVMPVLAQSPVPPAPAPTVPLTVEAAVALALRNNPTLTRALQDVQIAATQVDVARANRRPDVSVTANTTYTPVPSEVTLPGAEGEEGRSIQLGKALTASAQVTASQPLWPRERWQAPITIAEATVALTQEALRRTAQQLVFQTRQAYFQLQTSQELRRVAEDAVEVTRTQLRLARVSVEAGAAARLDIFQAEASLAEAEVNLVRAQNAVDVSRAALATQLGLAAGTPLRLTEPSAQLPALPASPDALTEQARTLRPELVQLEIRRTLIRANMALIRLQRRPLVNAQANYNQTILGGSIFGAEGFTLGASVAWAVYNGRQTEAELEGAHLQLAQLDSTARQIELGIGFDVRQAWLNLQNALEQLRAAQQQLTAASEALRIAQIRYESGEGIVLEVEQARLRRTQALTALEQARQQARTAHAQLDYAIGTPVALPPAP
jgi:outer membrane protein